MLRRVETGEHYVGEIPLAQFKGKTFEEKQYLDRAVEAVQEGLEALKISGHEPIRICMGYILSKAVDVLRERGFRVSPTKITGATQELAESEFIRSLVRLGVGDEETVEKMRSFRSFLRWVSEDLDGRERFVKTGWSAWPRLKKEATQKSAQREESSNCL